MMFGVPGCGFSVRRWTTVWENSRIQPQNASIYSDMYTDCASPLEVFFLSCKYLYKRQRQWCWFLQTQASSTETTTRTNTTVKKKKKKKKNKKKPKKRNCCRRHHHHHHRRRRHRHRHRRPRHVREGKLATVDPIHAHIFNIIQLYILYIIHSWYAYGYYVFKWTSGFGSTNLHISIKWKLHQVQAQAHHCPPRPGSYGLGGRAFQSGRGLFL